MELRPYQREAVEAVYEHLRTRDDNPCVVIPTAGGKTPCLSTICRDAVQRWAGRVLILAHVRELLEQAAEKLHLVAPDLPVGIYSAGLKRRDLGYAITIAGIQSIYEKACDVAAVDLVIVDECHLIPEDGEGMYRTFLADMKKINPAVRVIGMTATPFRMKSGTICAPDNILNAVCFEIGVRELIVQGYLCPLRTKAGRLKPDTGKLHVRGGEYIAGEVEDLMDEDNLVASACAEIVEHTQARKSVLIFASGVRHGQHVCRVMAERHQVECGFICGETLPFERDSLLKRFREGALKYLCNVNVLTTGFDAPNIDCVAMVRPTLSPGLYYQMVGRGFRLHPGKTDCLVLDFGGNVLRHGPVDQLRVCAAGSNGDGDPPAKECPKCHAVIATGYATCPECGHIFPPPERRHHEPTASSEGILSDQVMRAEYDVTDVYYTLHVKRDAPPDAPRTMRVDYRVGFNEYVSEWVCFEHSGFALEKARRWWRARSSEPVPQSSDEAVDLANAGALALTRSITVERKAGERFDRVVKYRLGDKPPRLDSEEGLPQFAPAIDDDSIPF
ncbi:MAG: DEAD/DEAH box helicase [Planctomycetia bacterium]|nr:MAG: DEAD/DEAH box helicase [Planctomycetia bacterium]